MNPTQSQLHYCLGAAPPTPKIPRADGSESYEFLLCNQIKPCIFHALIWVTYFISSPFIIVTTAPPAANVQQCIAHPSRQHRAIGSVFRPKARAVTASRPVTYGWDFGTRAYFPTESVAEWCLSPKRACSMVVAGPRLFQVLASVE